MFANGSGCCNQLHVIYLPGIHLAGLGTNSMIDANVTVACLNCQACEARLATSLHWPTSHQHCISIVSAELPQAKHYQFYLLSLLVAGQGAAVFVFATAFP